MPKKTKKPSALPDLISRLVPDRLEEAYSSVEDYLGAHAHLPGGQAARLAEATGELIDRCGESVQAILYDLLCNKKSSLHQTTEGALGNGVKAAVGVLVSVLVAQFALAPAVALVVATLAVKVIATQGEQALCKELAKRDRAQARASEKATGKVSGARRAKPKRRITSKHPSERNGSRKQPAQTRRKGAQKESA
jgi:hypothetical protein